MRLENEVDLVLRREREFPSLYYVCVFLVDREWLVYLSAETRVRWEVALHNRCTVDSLLTDTSVRRTSQ